MQAYLAAHDNFVAWIDALRETPLPGDVEERLWSLAVTAAGRGMTRTHWVFVVDGLVAHVNRLRPGDLLLSSTVARGFDLASRWEDVQAQVSQSNAAAQKTARG